MKEEFKPIHGMYVRVLYKPNCISDNFENFHEPAPKSVEGKLVTDTDGFVQLFEAIVRYDNNTEPDLHEHYFPSKDIIASVAPERQKEYLRVPGHDETVPEWFNLYVKNNGNIFPLDEFHKQVEERFGTKYIIKTTNEYDSRLIKRNSDKDERKIEFYTINNGYVDTNFKI